jgi:alkylation response protein AidB-like acyl-CoA dehydrogenase
MDEFLRVVKLKFIRMDKNNVHDRELLNLAMKHNLTKQMSCAELCKIVKEIAKFNPSIALSLTAHHLALHCLKDHELSKRDCFFAFAMTEKVGSDVKAVETLAEDRNGSYIVRGVKNFVTNAEFAEAFVVTAKRGERVEVFAVEKDGVKTERINLSCFRGSGIAKVYIDAEVPKENLLGSLRLAISALVRSRVVLASLALGIAERCFELALSRAKRRGLLDNRGIRWRFAEVKAEIEILKSFISRTARDADRRDITVDSAICKLKASELAKVSADLAVEIFGAKGLIAHTPTEILYRYAKSLDIAEGTNEIMREIISLSL